MARKPIGSAAMTNAQRQRDLRARRLHRIMTVDCEQWTREECLAALAMPKLRGTPIEQGAYRRLGELLTNKP